MNNRKNYKKYSNIYLCNHFNFFYKTIKATLLFTILISPIYANDKNLISNFIKDGCFYLNEGKYESAINHFNKALIKAKSSDLSQKIAESSYYTALCYYKTKNLEKASEFIDESFFELKNKDCDMLANLLLLKSCIAKEGGETDHAKIMCKKILKLKNVSPENVIISYLFMTEILLDEKDIKSSFRYLNKIKKNLQKSSDNKLKGWFYNVNGRYHTLNNNFKEAAICYLHMITSYKKAGISDQIATGLELAAKAFEKDNKYYKACELYFRSARSYYTQNDSKQGEANLEKATKLIKYASPDLKVRIKSLTTGKANNHTSIQPK